MVERKKLMEGMKKYPKAFQKFGTRQGEKTVEIRYQQKREPNYVYSAKIKELRDKIQKTHQIVGSGQQMGSGNWYWIIENTKG